MVKALAAAGALATASACGGNADDRAADSIEAMTENRADALEDAADEARAAADQKADALEAEAERARGR